MKNQVSVHYDNFKSVSEISHNTRKQKESKDLLKVEDRLPNILDLESEKKYNELYKKAKKANPRSWRKSSKPNIDIVMSWSWEQVKANIEKHGIEEYNKMLSKRLKSFSEEIEKEYGIKFVAFNLHNDEGKYNENGEAELNQHCHLSFLDFNFETKKRVLRTMHFSDFAKWQDIATKHFKDLDFERGIENSDSKHIESKEYKKLKAKSENEIEQELEELENEIQELTLEELEDLKIKYKNDKLKKRLIDYIYRAKQYENKNEELEKQKKNYDRILSTWEKIQNDGTITKEEQIEFQKILKASKYKTPDKKEVKNIQSALKK